MITKMDTETVSETVTKSPIESRVVVADIIVDSQFLEKILHKMFAPFG